MLVSEIPPVLNVIPTKTSNLRLVKDVMAVEHVSENQPGFCARIGYKSFSSGWLRAFYVFFIFIFFKNNIRGL